jgi:hypothetical protein
VQRLHGDWGEYLRVKEWQHYVVPTAPTDSEKFAEIELWKEEQGGEAHGVHEQRKPFESD